MNADDLDLLLTPPRWAGRRCTVAQALDDITDEVKRGKVAVACGNLDVAPKQIERAFMLLLEASPKPATIKRHQNKGCGC